MPDPEPTTPPPLVRACSWCQSEGRGPPPAPGQTHGICPAHAADVLAELCGPVDDRAGGA